MNNIFSIPDNMEKNLILENPKLKKIAKLSKRIIEVKPTPYRLKVKSTFFASPSPTSTL